MTNVRLSELNKTQSMQDTDYIVVVVGGREYLISKDNFSKVISLLTTEQKNKLSTILLTGDGTKVLTDSGTYKSLNTMFSKLQFELNDTTKLVEIKGYHTHSNNEVLDKFSEYGDTLLYNGSALSSYTLPIATQTSLGGVKVDGTTITVSNDGTISGLSNYVLPTASNTVLGGVKIDEDTIKINNGVISADVIGNWSSGVEYPVGYFAVHNDKLYQCTIANSDTEWTESKWNSIAGDSTTSANITEWTNNTDYSVNDLVIYENSLYKCVTAHISEATFNVDMWVSLSGAKGDKGEKGESGNNGVDGQNGVSPTITTTTTITGVNISITDVNGTQDVEISNGENGKDGVNGTDGITPAIDPDTKHWKIGEQDTGVIAEGRITVNADCAVVYATLLSTNWSETFPYTQTITVANITENNVPIVDLKLPEDSSLWETEESSYANLIKVETQNGSIIAYCKNKPESDFTIKMRIAGDVTGETFVTQDKFDNLYNIINNANTSLETILNGGEIIE